MIKKIAVTCCFIIIFYFCVANFKGFGDNNYDLSEQTIITTADNLGFNSYPYSNTYAGTWYQDGVLKSGTTNLFATGNQVTQTFSFNELVRLYVFMYSVKDNYSIVSIGVNQQNNHVTIMVENIVDIFKIKMLIFYRSGFSTALMLRGTKFKVGRVELI